MKEKGEKESRIHTVKRQDKEYPQSLSFHLDSDAPERLYALGDLSILNNPLSALLCSVRCPGDLLLTTYDLVHQLRHFGVTVISGFHSPLEKDCLEILLSGNQPLVICPARSIETMRLPREWRVHIDNHRLLLLSPFAAQKHIVRPQLAQYRNRFVAALSNDIYIVHAAPGSKTMALSQKALSWGKNVHTFDHPSNQHLLAIGAQPIPAGGKRER